MNISSYIYMSSRLEIRDTGVGTDINKRPNVIRKEIADKLKVNPYLSPLSSDLILYNSFNMKDQGTGTQVLAYYFQTFPRTKGISSVYRKEPNDEFYTYLCDMHGNYSMIDYGVKANAFYHYLIAYRQGVGNYKIYENNFTDEDGIQTPAYVNTKWDFWTICDIQETEEENLYEKAGSVWKLSYNLENGDLIQNLNTTSWETLGRFPKFSYGKKDYISGSISCFLGEISEYIDGEVVSYEGDSQKNDYVKSKRADGYNERINKKSKYAREVEKYDAWKKFVYNGNLKLLKDYKGNAWIVQIASSPTASINMQSNLMQTIVSFEWQEALDIDKIRVVSSDR